MRNGENKILDVLPFRNEKNQRMWKIIFLFVTQIFNSISFKNGHSTNLNTTYYFNCKHSIRNPPS